MEGRKTQTRRDRVKIWSSPLWWSRRGHKRSHTKGGEMSDTPARSPLPGWLAEQAKNATPPKHSAFLALNISSDSDDDDMIGRKRATEVL